MVGSPSRPLRAVKESLALQVHRRELMEALERAREPEGFPCVMAMVQDMLRSCARLQLRANQEITVPRKLPKGLTAANDFLLNQWVSDRVFRETFAHVKHVTSFNPCTDANSIGFQLSFTAGCHLLFWAHPAKVTYKLR